MLHFSKFEKKTLIIALILIVLIATPLAALIHYQKSYLPGFLWGSLLSLVLFLLNIYSTRIILSSKREKPQAYFFALVKFIIVIILVLGFSLVAIYSNKAYNGNILNGVFNIVFYIGAISIVPVSIFFSFIISYINQKAKKRKTNKQKEIKNE